MAPSIDLDLPPALDTDDSALLQDQRILIIDNYDSYTLNLLHILPSEITSARNFVIIRNDQMSWEYMKKSHFLDYFDAILLSPGPGSPEIEKDIGVSLDILRSDYSIPTLGVCLGHQALNTAFGGKIVSTPTILHGQLSSIQHNGKSSPDSVYFHIPNGFKAIRYNSLTVLESNVSNDLQIDAWCLDEDIHQRVVMGLSHKHRPLWGTQYHPESICSEYGRKLISNFLFLAQTYNHQHRSNHRIRDFSPAQTHCVLRETPIVERQSLASEPTMKIASFSIETSLSPIELLRNLDQEHNIFLISNPANSNRPAVTYIGISRQYFTYSVKKRQLSIYRDENEHISKLSDITFWQWQAELVKRLEQTMSHTHFDNNYFNGGIIGVNGYELKYECMANKICNKSSTKESIDAAWMLVDQWIYYDHECGKWSVHGILSLDNEYQVDIPGTDVSFQFGLSENKWKLWKDQAVTAAKKEPNGDFLNCEHKLEIPPFRPFLPKDKYLNAIRASQEYIRRGESYEVCMTTLFESNLAKPLEKRDIYELYERLHQHNPSRYSGLISFPQSSLSLISESPENFLRIERDSTGEQHMWAEMKPIKGTRKVVEDPLVNMSLIRELETDRKERAENLMIVDLIRNDLTRVCEPSSVNVPHLMKVESNQRVHSLVSTIRGRILSGISSVRVLEKSFPPGSMTGAPKLRTVQILEELEPVQRGAYSGVMGWFGVDGCTELSVIIRTCIVQGTNINIGAGGAITILSDIQEEWNEVLIKVKSLGLEVLEE